MAPDSRVVGLGRHGWWLLLVGVAGPVFGQVHRPETGPAASRLSPLPLRRIADSVYVVLGDTGRGSEGRANAGFVVTTEGVVIVDALGSPRDGQRLVQAIRRVSAAPLRWVVLTHHHPDHHFGAIALRRAGAHVMAHPDVRVLAAEAGDSALVADWTRVVGRRAMRGFAFADRPERSVTAVDTIQLGGRDIVVFHPGAAHSAGDLVVWLPRERVLFAGDILVEDGVTMVVDGSASRLVRALDRIDRLDPAVIVPGHGSISRAPAELISRTRTYITGLQAAMRKAVEDNVPLQRALAPLPPADSARPVSLSSRQRRNAVRVYLEEERAFMGLDSSADTVTPALAKGPGIISTEAFASLIRERTVRVVDVRSDVFAYLAGHLPGAAYLNTETLRATRGGVPIQLLSPGAYAELFSRLGIRLDQPVVIYSAGETRNFDATFLAWILAGFGHRQVDILDGGYYKWQLEQRPIERPYPRFAETVFPSQPFSPEQASLDDALAAMHDSAHSVLVDARPPDQYAGQAGSQMRLGHIPGAVNHYWQEDLQRDGFGVVWKPVEALRASYLAQGISPDKDIIAYCNGATEASHVYFTLRYLLGYPRVRIYVGSWTEWAERTELPIAQGNTAP